MEQSKLTSEQIAELQQYVAYGAAWLGPVLVEGSGCRVTDIDGKSYLVSVTPDIMVLSTKSMGGGSPSPPSSPMIASRRSSRRARMCTHSAAIQSPRPPR